MEDELEDKVLYQAYVSHMKLLSKFAVGVSSINSPLAYTWKLCRLYIFRPEVIFCSLIIFIFLIYLKAVDNWSRGLLSKIVTSFGYSSQKSKFKSIEGGSGDNQYWDETNSQSAAFALLGRRPRMEDRYIIDENVNNTGISIFAIFDGHGGEFAADFAKDILVKNLLNKITESTNLLKNQKLSTKNQETEKYSYESSPYLKRRSSKKSVDVDNKENLLGLKRKDSGKKTHSTTDDCTTNLNVFMESKTDAYLSKLKSVLRPAGNKENIVKVAPQNFEAKCYIENGKINFGKMITDEVLVADFKLVEEAKKTTNVAGTTALIAIMHGTKLIVANVGDSRGVMCDSKGNAIPLSFDHKPQQVRERKRIHDAGGFISFRGVWRVAGILATSRALGDYPLKDKNLVIADPDILTFELNDHRPSFLILASDGLWDTFTNEEAIAFAKEHLNDPQYGAKALALQSYYRGSVDNITVLIIVFKDGVYQIGSSSHSENDDVVNKN